MLKTKSIFISTAIMIWVIVSVLAFTNGFSNQGWHFGMIFTAVIPVIFIGQLFIFKTARTSKNLWILTMLGILGVCWGIWKYLYSTSHWAFMSLSFLSFILWVIYIYWYSVLPKSHVKGLKVGNKMPELFFLDQTGRYISNREFRGKKLIYLFYRGNWCPLCMAQIKEISKKYVSINKLGAEVLLISPQPHLHTINLARKMKVPFKFLTDVNNAVAKQLGIYAPGGTPLGMEIFGYESDTVLPTVIIEDDAENIIYVHQTDNYRVRPDPEFFLSIIDNTQ